MATEAQIKSLKHWKYLVGCKDSKSWPSPDGMPYASRSSHVSWKFDENATGLRGIERKRFVPDRHDDFSFFIKQFVQNILDSSSTGIDGMEDAEKAFESLEYDLDSISPNYWNHLMKDPKSDIVNKTINPIDGADKESKDKVYGAFMPAYRAIKESFDKRWFFEWFFNHKEYTTERKTMNALKGLMQALTRDNDAAFNEQYREYKGDVVLSDEDKAEIEERVQQDKTRFKEERKLKQEEDKKIEQSSKNQDLDESLDYEEEDEIEETKQVNDNRKSFVVNELREDPLNEKVGVQPPYKNEPTKELSNHKNQL